MHLLAKCPLAKCPLTKCPLAKCPLAKWALPKCLDTILLVWLVKLDFCHDGKKIETEPVKMEKNIETETFEPEKNTETEMVGMEKNTETEMVGMEKNTETEMVGMEKNTETEMVGMEKNTETEIVGMEKNIETETFETEKDTELDLPLIRDKNIHIIVSKATESVLGDRHGMPRCFERLKFLNNIEGFFLAHDMRLTNVLLSLFHRSYGYDTSVGCNNLNINP